MTGRSAGRVPVRGLEVAYHVWGRGDAPLVLCLHGFLDHGRSFEPIAEALSEKYRFVAIDFRGHGESGWVGDGGYYHFMDYVADAWALLRELAVERVSLLGHSMGGSVAAALAALLGPRLDSVVLLEGMGPPAEELSSAPDRLRRWVDALDQAPARGTVAQRRAGRRPMKDLEEATARLQRINPRVSSERARALAEAGTEEVPGGRAWRFDPLHRTPSARPFNVEEYRHHWRAVQAPVLSLYGAESEWMLADLGDRHGLLAELRAGLVDGAGHNIHHDRPEVVTAAVERWFAGERTVPPPGIIPAATDLVALPGGRW